MTGGWQFWADRGGTFTDLIARRPDGTLATSKLLSDNPAYDDAITEGIRRHLANNNATLDQVESIRVGTTVATNALLERKGEPTAFVITQGFRDALRIGYQQRPDIFALEIHLPDMLCAEVIEAEERLDREGNILTPLNESDIETRLQELHAGGIRALAIALMHGYRYPAHEKRIADMARHIGFTQISTSHEVSPLVKLIRRGSTAVLDAYLSPVLYRYTRKLQSAFPGVELSFMQSNGGLTPAETFHGRNSLLSGPAGGVVGAVKMCASEGIDKLIGFDMGGTSTDVCHYAGRYERITETNIAGVMVNTPMMYVHTVAAGGGSKLVFDGERYRVGPSSAGAMPGPACYRNGGPLTVTDCNLLLGKIQPQYFPRIFGPEQNRPLDADTVREKFTQLAKEIADATGKSSSIEDIAEGFLAIAIKHMASAIKKISVERGYNIRDYTLCSFGGAGGQHACLIADELDIPRILIPENAGMLSACGIGVADHRLIRQQTLTAPLNDTDAEEIGTAFNALTAGALAQLAPETDPILLKRAYILYEGTDKALPVEWNTPQQAAEQFEEEHRNRYGFAMRGKRLMIDRLELEAVIPGETAFSTERQMNHKEIPTPPPIRETVTLITQYQHFDAPVLQRGEMTPGAWINGPALILESGSTTVVEPGWQARLTEQHHLLLERNAPRRHAQTTAEADEKPDPVQLEVFNNLFMSIAEQMGVNLENTSYSVNIKERLDFSCALFDAEGELIANAPHMPVHLGSMGASVQALIARHGPQMRPGSAYATNNPYAGGTHLPDITVVAPVFTKTSERPTFYVASRGHHADIGGISPGSMPAQSTHIKEEGVLLDGIQILKDGRFLEEVLHEAFSTGDYPARNIDQNLADLQAQLAAIHNGEQELRRAISEYGQETVLRYARFIKQNAEHAVRKAIGVLKSGSHICRMDDGSEIHVRITIDSNTRSATVDFTGTSPQQPHNLNAPAAITRAAVLYVFRTLVQDNIPLNDGCLRPINLMIPQKSLLNPEHPAAVVGGNVETSQVIVNALYGALGLMAAAQGTMNNFSFGNNRYQYYETVCGGTGAGKDFDGCSAVQSHMTNSRLTDPEILEDRYPVLLEEFAIRHGSGGAGRHRGGNGVIRKLRFLEPMTASILSGSRKEVPFGLNGGEAGKTGRNTVQTETGEEKQLASRETVSLESGEVFCIETPGGGGYGKKQ